MQRAQIKVRVVSVLLLGVCLTVCLILSHGLSHCVSPASRGGSKWNVSFKNKAVPLTGGRGGGVFVCTLDSPCWFNISHRHLIQVVMMTR